jgi:cytochrome bd ubiquinol oxidase subunit II
VAALLFGVAWANFVHGVPMGPNHVIHASLLDLLHPYALLGGLVTVSLFLSHGAYFLTLRTKGELAQRAALVAHRVAPVAAVLTVGFLVWTAADQSWDAVVVVLAILAAAAAVLIPVALDRSPTRAFAGSCVAIALLFVVLLAALFPNAVPSSTNHAYDLTLVAASSTSYTLTVMTVVAVIFVPIVLVYQAWTYWVFRHRLGRDDFEGPATPIAVIEHTLGNGGPATTGAQPPTVV